MPITKDNTAGVLREVDRRISAGLKEVAPGVVSMAKILVPVVSGDLQRSIIAEFSKDKVVVGSPLDYAVKIETDNPYLRPALEANKINIRRIFKTK